jgi:hypothetical protein
MSDWDAWGSVSFAATLLSIVGRIDDPDHSLPPGMYVDVPHLDCLLVAASITVEGLDHLILKPKQLDGMRTCRERRERVDLTKMTHFRHWLCTAAMVLIPVSAPIKVLI